MVAELAGVHTFHLCLYFIRHCFQKDFSAERSRAHRHTRRQLFCFTFGPFFLFFYLECGRSPRTVCQRGGGSDGKKGNDPTNVCCFRVLVHVTFFEDLFFFSVCRGWQQQCNSLSLACNRLIYLWHTILSDLHCVRCVTLTQTFTVTSRIILAAIPGGEVLTWGSVCKQGCCICLISPVLKWRDSKNLTRLDFTCKTALTFTGTVSVAPCHSISGPRSLPLQMSAVQPNSGIISPKYRYLR